MEVHPVFTVTYMLDQLRVNEIRSRAKQNLSAVWWGPKDRLSSFIPELVPKIGEK